MTISEIAAQMGVTPETLVQEVCKQQTEMTMLTVVCGYEVNFLPEMIIPVTVTSHD